MSDYKFPLNQSFKHQLVSLLSEALQHDVKDVMSIYKLDFFNSVHFLTWDFIYTRVYKNVQDESKICIKCKRGPWSFVLMYDLKEKYLYSFMKEKRLAQLIDERNRRSSIHYADALVTLNKNITELGLDLSNVEQQLDLLPLEEDSDWEKSIEKILKDMLGVHYGGIKNYVVVTFSHHRGEIDSVNATLLSPCMDVVYKENWDEFINVEYEKNDDVPDTWSLDEDEDDGDSIVKLKSHLDEEEETADDLDDIARRKDEKPGEEEKDQG